MSLLCLAMVFLGHREPVTMFQSVLVNKQLRQQLWYLHAVSKKGWHVDSEELSFLQCLDRLGRSGQFSLCSVL